MSIYALLMIMGACILACAIAIAVLVVKLKGHKDHEGTPDEIARLNAELSTAQAVARAKEESLLRRIEDKEESLEKVLKEKELAYDMAMKSKDKSCSDLLREKDAACASAIAEKEQACAKLLAEKDADLRRKDEECARMMADRDRQCAQVIMEKNAEIEQFLKEKEKSFAEAVRTLQERFVNIATQTLKGQSVDLSTMNKAHLEDVLKPLREQIVRLQDLTQKAQSENVNLGKTIARDVDAIGRIAEELSGVATALSSNTRIQGRKGEEILAEKLKQAGLEENVNFFLQTGIDTDRPDAQVCDTENRWLIIDSKVSLTSYIEYMEATDDTVRADKLSAHVASVRQKIDQLARKKYPKVFAAEHCDRDYLPITAMFVPYEAPLMVALQEEPSLWQYAVQNNVILITPLTLLGYLRLVYLAWQHEKESRNQMEIVNTARELLTRMNSFLLTFESIGQAIESLQDTYAKARNVMVDAPHAQTIAKSAQKLIGLHVRLENRKGKRLETAECLKTEEDHQLEQVKEVQCQESLQE